MYQQPPVKSSSKAPKSRLGLKLAALFLGTFLTVFIVLFFFDLLRSMGESAIVNAAASKQPAIAAIDPNLQTDLAKVMQQNDAQTTADIKNPFADTTGISAKYNPTTVSGAVQPNTAARTANQTGGGQVAAQRAASQSSTVTPRTVQPNQAMVNPLQPQIDTRERLRQRDERINLGMEVGPEAAAYAIDDLLPVGTVSGGDGKEEAMFFSTAACRVVSFPVGTQFYDGWFDSLRQEGVVFGFFDQYRTKRMRAWGRSITQGCTQGLLEQTSPNQALTTTGGGGE